MQYNAIVDIDQTLDWVFGQQAPTALHTRPPPTPQFWVPLPIIDGAPEVWQGFACSRTQTLPSGVVYGDADQDSIIAIELRCEASPDTLTDGTDALYEQALAYLSAHQLVPFRIWNFVPGINRGDGDNESYRRFCVGRAAALARHNYSNNKLPAASALGSTSDQPLVCLLLASRSQPLHIENPRQVPAYDYPTLYGPKPPTFARATRLMNRLYLSGTASITGHQSRHPGDIDAQVLETCRNIEALLEHAAPGTPLPTAEAIRVYLRHVQHQPRVAQRLSAAFPDAKLCYLQADICRKELLVELEGTFRLKAT